MWLIIQGLIVHVIFLVSIFDIYFKSPIISGINIQPNVIKPPAKRLVLFVADGLRADSFYSSENGTYTAPYLRSVIEEKGSWGVCHARVPTESRPGHVAIIAGFYEDPSAVFKGWKENPIEFDSLFNQSTITYSWGSPDILPIFSKGLTNDKMFTHMYSSEIESFSGENESASYLSKWVFNEVEHFIKNAKVNSSVSGYLHKNGVILFLHLLGTDVAGHVNKPHSREYKENIKCIDEGIEKTEKLIRDFYNDDNETVFIMTADHGMTDWGSHGDGSTSETETPIVMWGAGISQPVYINQNQHINPKNWYLDNYLRNDMNQADLVPLMSILIGIPIPVHSLGTIPLPFLNVDEQKKAEVIFLNTRQLYNQFKRHQEIIENNSVSWLYKQFPKLNKDNEIVFFKTIQRLISNRQYEEAISECKVLISILLLGLKYYQNYYQHFLLFSISCSFIGWIAWLSVRILSKSKKNGQNTRKETSRKHFVNIIFIVLFLVTISLNYAQNVPHQHYVYCCLPIILWWNVFLKYKVFFSSFSYIRENISGFFLALIVYGIGLECLVLAFFYRWILCILLCGLGIWPLFEKQLVYRCKILLLVWAFSCFSLAIFPALPTIGSSPNVRFVTLAGWLWFLAGIIFIINQIKIFKNKEDCLILIFQLSLLPLTIWIVSSTSDSYSSKEGLPLLNQVLSWALLIICPLVPLVSSVKIIPRLAEISLSLAVPFILLSVGHEALFSVVLMFNLFSWIYLEKEISSNKIWDEEITMQQEFSKTDFRRSFFFIIYIIISFFGTGNVASINSFDPVWVRCFLTVFAPFTMTILILIKMLIPFLLVSCSFRALNVITKARTDNLFIIMLILCEFLGLHFLYFVTNEGSWLQIGMSISHYVIIQAMILYIVTLYMFAKFYMHSSLFSVVTSKSKYLSRQSLESKAAYVNKIQFQSNYSLFDKRHVE